MLLYKAPLKISISVHVIFIKKNILYISLIQNSCCKNIFQDTDFQGVCENLKNKYNKIIYLGIFLQQSPIIL